jgi:hypothetical protein
LSTLTLQVEQASQRYTVPGKLESDELDQALSHGADVVGFTEVRSFHDELARACGRHHYALLLPPKGSGTDSAIAVLASHRIESTGYVPVVEPSARPRHSARGIQWVQLTPDGTSERVTVCSGHWLTERSDEGHQRIAMTRAMADVVREAAAGDRLAFWTGDTNNPDHELERTPVDRALRKAELTSCWDELGRYPATGPHGGTIDVVGSYDPDRRVECLRARRWVSLYSDHQPVSAWYRISRVRLANGAK